MFRCKLYQFLLRFIPLAIGRDFILRRHVEDCPRCETMLAMREEVRPLLWSPDQTQAAQEIWLAIECALSRKESRRYRVRLFYPRKWGWKRAVAGLLFFFLLAALFILQFRQEQPLFNQTQPEQRFQIKRFQVKDQPAVPIIYKPFGSDLIFIWAERMEINSDT